MKPSLIILISAMLAATACGSTASLSSGQRFSDGIYYVRQKEAPASAVADAQQINELAERTRNSEIYLFGDEKADTVVIPENKSAVINFDNSSVTSITITDDPFEQTWYTGYSFTPVSWTFYWNRWWDPWFYGSIGLGWYYDPWYWTSWYWNPWYWNSWYWDPWYYRPYWSGWYHPYWHHHHCGWYDGYHGGGIWHGGRDIYYGSRNSTGSYGSRTSSMSRNTVSRNATGTTVSRSARTSGVSRSTATGIR